MKRRLQDWGATFEEYTTTLGVPAIFNRWCAIAAIGGALERKVWLISRGRQTFPNTYITLVAPPGIGKSMAIDTTRQLWNELDDHKIAANSVSKASLVDELALGERNINPPKANGQMFQFHSLKIAADELGVLLPSYDMEFMSAMTAFYDCSIYRESKRTKDIKIEIKHPCVNLLAGSQPGFLRGLLPDIAWEQGFMSRMLLIYSGEKIYVDLFNTPEKNEQQFKNLAHDLRIISNLWGKFEFEPAAAYAIQEWDKNDGPPAPTHPKLRHYNTRRTFHILKLSMIASVMRDNELLITEEDFHTAKDWLIEAETYIPDIFKAMSSGGDSAVIEEAWYFCLQYYTKNEKAIPQTMLYRFLQQRLPSHSIEAVTQTMEKAGLLKAKRESGRGVCYTPVGQDTLGE